MTTPNIQAEALSEAESIWLKEQRETCQLIVSQLIPQYANDRPTVPDLHQAFDLWLDQFNRSQKKRLFSKKPDAIDPNTIALCFGVVLGDHLIASTPLEWKIVTDEFGTDLMLYALGSAEQHSDIVTSPVSMVAKRIENRESNWLKPTFEDLTNDIRNMTDTA